MKDTHIVRIKAYIGFWREPPYACNELPVSGKPSKYFADKSVRSLITTEQYYALVNLLNEYNSRTSPYAANRIEKPWFFEEHSDWFNDYNDHRYMLFDLEVETQITVHETPEDDKDSEYIKVSAKDMKLLLQELKDKKEKETEELEKKFTQYFGI